MIKYNCNWFNLSDECSSQRLFVPVMWSNGFHLRPLEAAFFLQMKFSYLLLCDNKVYSQVLKWWQTVITAYKNQTKA